jgi:hypothetical protein
VRTPESLIKLAARKSLIDERPAIVDAAKQRLVRHVGCQDPADIPGSSVSKVCVLQGTRVGSNLSWEVARRLDEPALLQVPDLDWKVRVRKIRERIREAVVGAPELEDAVAVDVEKPVTQIAPIVLNRPRSGARALPVIDEAVEAAVASTVVCSKARS